MLAIQQSKDTNQAYYTPNILPCAIKHNGPVQASERYWNPEVDENGKQTAYFRGRKLQGRTVKLPAGYQGESLLSILTCLKK